MKKAIIFDYDGVLVDSFPSVHKAYLKICEKLNKKCPSDLEDFKKIYGYSSKDLMKNLDISGNDVDKANLIYKREIVKIDSPLFNGIKEVVEKLSKKHSLVLISSSPREEVMQKLDRGGLSNKFKLIFASDKLGPMGKSAAIEKTIEELNLNPEEIIMIGDRTIDYDEGFSAGIPSENIIIVDYGWGYDKEKIPRQVFIKRPLDLLKTIEIMKN